jgi:hypothetical protein
MSLIAAHEHWDVAIIDIPNAFIQTVVEDDNNKVVMGYADTWYTSLLKWSLKYTGHMS